MFCGTDNILQNSIIHIEREEYFAKYCLSYKTTNVVHCNYTHHTYYCGPL